MKTSNHSTRKKSSGSAHTRPAKTPSRQKNTHAQAGLIQAKPELFQQIIENSNDVIYKLNLQTKTFEYVNSAISRFSDFTPHEFLALGYEGILSRIHPHDREQYRAQIQKDMAGGFKPQQGDGFQFRWKGKNNRYCWFSARYAYILDEHGRAEAKIGIVRDVTQLRKLQRQLQVKQEHLETLVEKKTAELKNKNEKLKKEAAQRKKTEESLAEERNLLRTLIDALPDPVFAKNCNSRFILCNKKIVTLSGKTSPEQMIGKCDYDFLRPELADRYFAQEQEILRTGKSYINEEQIGRTPQGEDTWVLSSKIPLRNRNGKIIGLIGSNRDITQLKLAEQALAAYREKIIQAEQISQLGLLSATMAHELNQPLTVIQLLIQDCLAELEKNPSGRELVENLKDSLDEVESANAIIQRYRNVLRLRQEGTSKPIHIYQVADRIAQALSRAAQQCKVKIVVDDLTQLPAVSGKIYDYEQVFFILAQNAIQAADQKKMHTLHITGERLDSHIELRFADDCGGVAPEHLDKIFDLFFTTKPQQIGTGFGLCIARRILQNYGGKLDVKSQLGQGSTFYVQIPIPAGSHT